MDDGSGLNLAYFPLLKEGLDNQSLNIKGYYGLHWEACQSLNRHSHDKTSHSAWGNVLRVSKGAFWYS